MIALDRRAGTEHMLSFSCRLPEIPGGEVAARQLKFALLARPAAWVSLPNYRCPDAKIKGQLP
jgi:hypothetical protein